MRKAEALGYSALFITVDAPQNGRRERDMRNKPVLPLTDSLKDSVQQTLNLLPENALVGLITFGAHVLVHEIGFGECHKSIAFRGSKEYVRPSLFSLLSRSDWRRSG